MNGKFNLAKMEKQTIIDCLRDCNNNRTNTAKRLGISVRTLRNKLNLYRKDKSLSAEDKEIIKAIPKIKR